jgi:hypothetical protein
MREIKFRFIGKHNSDDIRFFTIEEIMEERSRIHFNDFYINEFTWLKDKNWIDIYEWDILHNLIKNSTTVEYKEIYYEYWMAIWFNWLSNHSEVVSNIYKKREENTYNYNNWLYD